MTMTKAAMRTRQEGRVTNAEARMPQDMGVVEETVRTTDDKGRLYLGGTFANVTFILRQGADSTEYILTKGCVIPARELWLYKNPQALASVQRGLQQARDGKVSDNPPDVAADCALVEDADEE